MTTKLTDPEFIRDIEQQMEGLEDQMDFMPINTNADATNYFNLVQEHADLEDILQSLLDVDGHDAE